MKLRKRLTAMLMAMMTAISLVGYTPVAAAGHTNDETCGYREGSPCTHTVHNEDCGYVKAVEGSACSHVHDDSCYQQVTDCTHKHTDQCRMMGSDTNPSNPEAPSCTHVCSVEDGCITNKLNCPHTHNADCGYVEAKEGQPCKHEQGKHDASCGYQAAAPCNVQQGNQDNQVNPDVQDNVNDLIANTDCTVPSETANTKDEVENWLKGTWLPGIKTALQNKHGIILNDLMIVDDMSFVPAKDGTQDQPNGENGSYSFVIKAVIPDVANEPTPIAEKECTISAKAYTPPTLDKVAPMIEASGETVNQVDNGITVTKGKTVILTAELPENAAAHGLQWQKKAPGDTGFQDIADATAATLNIPTGDAQFINNSQYQCAAVYSDETVTSVPVTITVVTEYEAAIKAEGSTTLTAEGASVKLTAVIQDTATEEPYTGDAAYAWTLSDVTNFSADAMDQKAMTVTVKSGAAASTATVGLTVTVEGKEISAQNVTITYVKQSEVEPDKTNLQTALTEAETLLGNTAISADGADVLVNQYWVTETVKNGFNDKIASAKAVYNAADATQAKIDDAVATLNNAIETFKDAQKAGTKVNKSNLNAAIAIAKVIMKDTVISVSNGFNVEKSKYWVTPAIMSAAKDALVEAEAIAAKTDATQAEVDNATVKVKEKINRDFKNSKKQGTKKEITYQTPNGNNTTDDEDDEISLVKGTTSSTESSATSDTNSGVTVNGSTVTVTPSIMPASVFGGEAQITAKIDATSVLNAAQNATPANPYNLEISIPESDLVAQLEKSGVNTAAIDVVIPSAVTNSGKVKVSNISVDKTVIKAAKTTGKDVQVAVKDEKGQLSYAVTLSGSALKNSGIQVTDMNFGAEVKKTPNGSEIDLKNRDIVPGGQAKISLPGFNPNATMHVYLVTADGTYVEAGTIAVDAAGNANFTIGQGGKYAVLTTPPANVLPVKSNTMLPVIAKDGDSSTIKFTTTNGEDATFYTKKGQLNNDGSIQFNVQAESGRNEDNGPLYDDGELVPNGFYEGGKLYKDGSVVYEGESREKAPGELIAIQEGDGETVSLQSSGLRKDKNDYFYTVTASENAGDVTEIYCSVSDGSPYRVATAITVD